MTSYVRTMAFGPVAGTLTDNTKGSVGNRVDCAGAHIKNNFKSGLQYSATGAALMGTVYAAAKNPKAFDKAATKFTGFLSKNLVRLSNQLSKQPMLKLFSKECSALASKMTNPNAILVGAILGATALVTNYITRNHAYKAGQIDQKYTDKAKLQEFNS